jgi:hypothetical protein
LPFCVLRGTPITTPSGQVAVEDLHIGQDVVCVSEAGDEVVGQVAAKTEATTGSYFELKLEGCERPLRLTSAHPVAGATGWVPAGDLRVGDWVQTRTGLRRISELTVRREDVRVYDLAVRPYPTFLAADVVVHNKSVALPPKPEAIAGSWVGSDDSRLYRLDLHPDGTGLFAWAQPKHPAQLYSVEQWTLRPKVSTGILEFQIRALETRWDTPAMRLRGTASSATHLALEVGMQKHETAWSWLCVKMIREGDYEAQSRTVEELKRRMAPPRASQTAATNPADLGD